MRRSNVVLAAAVVAGAVAGCTAGGAGTAGGSGGGVMRVPPAPVWALIKH